MKIGCDIVDLKRINLENKAFLRGILTKNELLLLEKKNNKKDFVGGRFAAKEAFLKALGSGLSGARMNEIEINYRESGQPFIYFDSKEYEVSISHDGDYAMAVVII